MQLEDWLDDLCVRFIINLPPEELESVERICFQVEEAQWFYEDFIRPLDPTLPSLSLRAFSLRIFQHCPLFSQWSAQHHTTAFEEFLAYKQRVPVRGAIMLNDAMDEIVLVKGWKKSANWSFPRGKINKDESDLDCAVREVYEETGFDIRAAGLVKDEKDMKYIEVTMREQHMRLYVFRGVPKDTHFEPRTRKEISKIEWYKLTDLPTLKKNKHQDSNVETLAINANKFYMVAPFLNPLKKWIAQQRKSDNRQSSQANHVIPSTVREEPVAEIEPGIQEENAMPNLGQVTSYGPSDLPEVSVSHPSSIPPDPSSHLKRLLNINSPENQGPFSSQPTILPSMSTNKSSALLALLRGDSTAELRDGPNTPLEQISFSPELPRSPYRAHPRPPPFSAMPPPPQFPIPPIQENFQHQFPHNHSRAFQPTPWNEAHIPDPTFAPSMFNQMPNATARPSAKTTQQVAPYQNTGDPQFSHQKPDQQHEPAIPPASALPTLTTHTRALLDVFKTAPTTGRHEEKVLESPMHPEQDVSSSSKPNPLREKEDNPPQNVWAERAGPPFSASAVDFAVGNTASSSAVPRPQAGHQASLLDLFKQPTASEPIASPDRARVHREPAELAANPTMRRSEENTTQKNELLLTLLKKEKEAGRSQPKRQHHVKAPREGETSATVSGPLNQPQFDAIVKSGGQSGNGLGRDPLSSNRTLYDPKHPTPIKILSRPDESRLSPARSPRSPRANKTGVGTSSPKRISTPKETSKPFQPQILRRPQTAEVQNVAGVGSVAEEGKVPPETADVAGRRSSNISLEPPISAVQRQTPEVDQHRQNLLSLFGKPSQTGLNAGSARGRFDTVSPLSASQMVSPVDERPRSGEEPISTRPRISSITSIASGSIRPSIEKRQTGAEDKAFLLGYLGRIANRDGGT